MKLITITIFICAFFLYRPYAMQDNGMMYSQDDYGYFAHAAALAFGQFPSYDKEYFQDDNRPRSTIGPGVMAAPFVFAFSFLDRISGSSIGTERNAENVPKSWSQFGFIMASGFYFYVGCFFLYKGLGYFFSRKAAALSIIMMVLCQGLPLYIYRRPIFSHAYEFFLQSCLIFILVKIYHDRPIALKKSMAGTIGSLVGLTFLVRQNNIFAALLWPFILFLSAKKELSKKKLWGQIFLTYATAALIVVVFRFLPDAINQPASYGEEIKRLTTLYPFIFYIKRVFHIVMGIDWGLIYTAPFILLGLAVLIFNNRVVLRKQLLFCLLPLLFNVYSVITWKTQGSWYGYRYILASLAPLLVIPLADFLNRLKTGRIKHRGQINLLLSIITLLPVLSMLCFEGNTSLNLKEVEQYFGILGMGHNTYQMEVWEIFLFYPIEFLKIISQGGIEYAVYLGSFLKPNYFKNYPSFELTVLIKTLLIYLCPFLLYKASKRIH